MATINVAIIGASGYSGGELLRLLLQHKEVHIAYVTSKHSEGKPVTSIHKNLLHYTDLKFSDLSVQEIANKVDIMFFCLPHGESMAEIIKIYGKTKIIDLSGDFRLNDPKLYENYYKIQHLDKTILAKSVYGLPENNRELIREADLIGNPGCFPTASILALLPLAKENLLKGNVIINAITGSSGSGQTPKPTTHHPERSQNFRAYDLFNHRHQPEIAQILLNYSKEANILFTPHSAPISRGIFATCYTFLQEDYQNEDLLAIYEKYYKNEFFIRLVDDVNLNEVNYSNFCNISIKSQGKSIIILSAIDNLLKGAAGQAVQNMNILFNLDEKTGLNFPSSFP